LPLFYGGKKLAHVSCPVLAWDPKLIAPNFAFIDSTWRHGTHIKLGEGRQPPRKHHISSNALENLPIDPYHVAILIAMAQDVHQKTGGDISQAKVYSMLQRNKLKLTNVQVNLLTPSKERNTLILYKAVISHEYLQKFNYPRKHHEGELSITKLEVPLDNLDNVVNIFSHIPGDYNGVNSLVDGTENPGTKIKADEKPNGDKKPKDIKKSRVDEMPEVNIRLNVKAEQDTKAEPQLTLSCIGDAECQDHALIPNSSSPQPICVAISATLKALEEITN
jgi:hypothetical protein